MYPDKFKEAVVSKIKKGNSILSVAREYSISPATAASWVRKRSTTTTTSEPQTTDREIERLSKQNTALKLVIADMFIDRMTR